MSYTQTAPNGLGPFSDCQTNPVSWALNNQNPYDPTNFFYAHKYHHWIEDMTNRAQGVPLSGPYEDMYQGTIIKDCTTSDHDLGSHCDGLHYKVMLKTENNGTQNDTDNPLVKCLNDNDDASFAECCGGDIGQPCLHGDTTHFVNVRDWDKVMKKWGGKPFCCTLPASISEDDPRTKGLGYDRSKDSYGYGPCFGEVPGGPKGFIRTMKCPPTYWPGSPLCVSVMEDHCSNTNNWLTSDVNENSFCDLYMVENNGASTVDQKTVLVAGLGNWVKVNLKNGELKPSSSDPRVKKFADYCSQYPGLCDVQLKAACKNVKKDDLAKNPELNRLCGCFMDDNEYLLPGIIPVECNGVCAINDHPDINGVMRGFYNPDTGLDERLLCNQNTCVIDDVSVTLAQSQLDGKINFNQLCGNCPGGNCTCVYNNITIDAANSKLKGGIDFNQECRTCAQQNTNADGTYSCSGVKKSIEGFNGTEILSQEEEKRRKGGQEKKGSWWWLWVMIIVVILILLAVFFL